MNCVDARLVDPPPFPVHGMLLVIIDLYRLKRAETDVQSHARPRDAALLEAIEDGRREMQARRRRRDGAGLMSVDRLITIAIGGMGLAFANVRRQRNLAMTLEQ